MKFSENILITVLFSLTFLTSMASKAEREFFELQVESEIATADAVFDVADAKKSEESLRNERETHANSVRRLREEIQQAYVTQNKARKEVKANEKLAVRLENERTAAQTELNIATIQLQKIDRLLKSAQGHALRKQKSLDATIEKRKNVMARMMERAEISQAMVDKALQAEKDLKIAQAQYQKTLQLERQQKSAIAKKHNTLKKRIAEAKVKTNRVKTMMKKFEMGRAG